MYTPRKMNSPHDFQDLESLLLSISTEFGFPLAGAKGHVYPRSPSGKVTLQEECRNLLYDLFWDDRAGLRDCLKKFRAIIASSPRERKISSLNLLLEAQRRCKRQSGVLPSASASASNSFLETYIEPALATPSATSRNASFATASSTPRKGGASFGSPSPSQFSNPVFSAGSSFTDPGDERENGFEGPSIISAVPLENPFAMPSVNYRVRDLPIGGLFAHQLPDRFNNASPRVRYEATRLATSWKIAKSALEKYNPATWEDYEVLWSDLVALKQDKSPRLPRCSAAVWSAAQQNNSEVRRIGQLCFGTGTERDTSIFHLELRPLEYEGSCRFSRAFGAHRFLTIYLPRLSFGDLPQYLKDHGTQIRQRVQDWLKSPRIEMMRYQWAPYFARTAKPKKSGNRSETERKGYEIFFFATDGPDLASVTIEQLVNWFMPLNLNLGLNACKAFARLELGLSTTFPTVEFKPSQVRHVPDILADGTLEATCFDDANFHWNLGHDPLKPKVMNDGCSRISMTAAEDVWNKLGGVGACPSVFQGRIGPWKGVWMLDTTPQTKFTNEVWIEVTPSQQKFDQHPDDLADTRFDPGRLTFEVINWSRKSTPSTMYLDFLPILGDRGVPRNTLARLTRAWLSGEKEALTSAMRSPQTLYKWIQDTFPTPADYLEHGPRSRGAMPGSLAEKLKLLLRSGFDLPNSSYLRMLTRTKTSNYFQSMTAELKIPIQRSTTVFGVADPTGCLEPGEIHLAFSEPIQESSQPFLHEVNVLVARQPALRASDIQKVRAVYKVELRHLVNVVVFPTRGVMPLASKLQGGDYDGDKFWICWEEDLTKDFRNAPPSEPPFAEKLGVKVDRTTVSDIFEKHCDPMSEFLSRNFKFAFQDNLLGIVTNFFYSLSYMTKTVRSDTVNAVADLHDVLVDTTKNGFTFSHDDWTAFRTSFEDIPERLDQPEYKSVTAAELFQKGGRRCTGNSQHICDYLVFEVARHHTQRIISDIERLTSSNFENDKALTFMYTGWLRSENEVVKSLLKDVTREMSRMYNQWIKRSIIAENQKVEAEKRRLHNEAIIDAHNAYEEVRPTDVFAKDDQICSWLTAPLPGMLTMWDCLKASLLLSRHSAKPEFVFGCAGETLCRMKAYSSGRPNVIVNEINVHMKMSKLKRATDMEEDVFNVAGTDDDDCEFPSSVTDGEWESVCMEWETVG